jgi:hypothetical protein
MFYFLNKTYLVWANPFGFMEEKNNPFGDTKEKV